MRLHVCVVFKKSSTRAEEEIIEVGEDSYPVSGVAFKKSSTRAEEEIIEVGEDSYPVSGESVCLGYQWKHR